MNIYPAEGSRLTAEQAQRYGERVLELYAEHHQITKDAVLADATKRRSPLHDFFEWDDQAASHLFRLDQARYLLRSLEIRVARVVHGEEQQVPVRLFHMVKEKNGEEHRFLVTLQDAQEDPEQFDQIVADALRGLVAYVRKHRVLTQLSGIIDSKALAQKALEFGIDARDLAEEVQEAEK